VQTIYGYESIKTNEPVYVKNLINNGDNMTSSTGWLGGSGGLQIGRYPLVETTEIVDDEEVEIETPHGYIFFPTNTVIKNTGLTTNRMDLNGGRGLTKNQHFMLVMSGCDASANNEPNGTELYPHNLPTIRFYVEDENHED